MLTKAVAKILRANGYTVAVGSRITNFTPRGHMTVRGSYNGENVFVNCVCPYAIVDGASLEQMQESSATEATYVVERLVEAGFQCATPVDYFPGMNNKPFTTKPLGGFYVWR